MKYIVEFDGMIKRAEVGTSFENARRIALKFLKAQRDSLERAISCVRSLQEEDFEETNK